MADHPHMVSESTSPTPAVALPEALLELVGMKNDELCAELAIMLYQQERISLAQGGRISGLGSVRFQFLLASRNIPVNYDVEDFEDDLETLKGMGRL